MMGDPSDAGPEQRATPPSNPTPTIPSPLSLHFLFPLLYISLFLSSLSLFQFLSLSLLSARSFPCPPLLPFSLPPRIHRAKPPRRVHQAARFHTHARRQANTRARTRTHARPCSWRGVCRIRAAAQSRTNTALIEGDTDTAILIQHRAAPAPDT